MPTTANTGSTIPASEQDAQKVSVYNVALNEIDAAFGGQLSLSVAGSSNVALTRTQSLNAFYVFSGVLTGNIQVSWPASGGSARNLRVYNATTGAFSLTLVVAGGSGVAITQGEIRDYVIDGTTVRPTNVTAGTYTQSSGTAIWARVYHNASQSISDSTLTVLAFNTERADTDTIHDTVTNNSRLTCKTAGLYLITFNIDFDSNTTGFRSANIKLNGTTYLGGQAANAINGAPNRLTSSTVYGLAVNDYVQVEVYQTSGGALNVPTGANYTPEFSMVRLGGA